MKNILLTISLILGATVASGDIYYGKDALEIVTSGQIVNEHMKNDTYAPDFYKYFTIIKDL